MPLLSLLVGVLLFAGCSREERLAEGKELYDRSCASCHLANGEGKIGVGPPLVDSEWVLDSPERLTKICMYGMRGPIQVKGKSYNLEMPGIYYYQFNDEEMANVLSYIRQSWGNDASMVSASLVAKVRSANGVRDSWTVEELESSE